MTRNKNQQNVLRSSRVSFLTPRWQRFQVGSAAILVAAGLVFYPATSQASQEEGDLQIIPATKIPADSFSAPAEGDAPVTHNYVDIYQSIPFSRAEYLANPSYRHDTAVELMFGQMRNTTVVRYAPQPKVTDYEYITPYGYSLGGRARTYNFFYPRPSGYRRY